MYFIYNALDVNNNALHTTVMQKKSYEEKWLKYTLHTFSRNNRKLVKRYVESVSLNFVLYIHFLSGERQLFLITNNIYMISANDCSKFIYDVKFFWILLNFLLWRHIKRTLLFANLWNERIKIIRQTGFITITRVLRCFSTVKF